MILTQGWIECFFSLALDSCVNFHFADNNQAASHKPRVIPAVAACFSRSHYHTEIKAAESGFSVVPASVPSRFPASCQPLRSYASAR
jgi:hypothetical protein